MANNNDILNQKAINGFLFANICDFPENEPLVQEKSEFFKKNTFLWKSMFFQDEENVILKLVTLFTHKKHGH